MKYFQKIQRQASRMYRRLRAPKEKQERATLYEEMEMGAVTGFFACTALALYFVRGDLTALMLVGASLLGIFLGAVIGAVLWIGSAELPEDKVRAPAPGQGRLMDERRRDPR